MIKVVIIHEDIFFVNSSNLGIDNYISLLSESNLVNILYWNNESVAMEDTTEEETLAYFDNKVSWHCAELESIVSDEDAFPGDGHLLELVFFCD